MKLIKLDSPSDRSHVCEKILRALPDWFGIESAIVDYIKDVEHMDTWVAQQEDKIIGFLSVNKHNKITAEIHVMAIMPEYHRQNIGKSLVETAEKSLKGERFKYLTVKTLSESHPDKFYSRTRNFYLKIGFEPLEEFKTLWGSANPCLMLIKSLRI